MLERLHNIINRKPEHPKTFQKTTEEHPETEARKKEYLSTLDQDTLANVLSFIEFTKNLDTNITTAEIALTAVGSSTQPEEVRRHSVEDIDLRILNSAPAYSKAREASIQTIRDSIRTYLNDNNIKFKESDSTTEERMVKGIRFDTDTGKNIEELMPYLDWYNEDPSFTTSPDAGLPLHISISGIDNYPLDKYLDLERERNTPTAILVQPKR